MFNSSSNTYARERYFTIPTNLNYKSINIFSKTKTKNIEKVFKRNI